MNGRLQRVIRIVGGLESNFDSHAGICGDRVLAIALSDKDWDELQVAEIWGLPVLADADLSPGRVKLLCEANGQLIPPHDTVEDILNHCRYRLKPTTTAPTDTV